MSIEPLIETNPDLFDVQRGRMTSTQLVAARRLERDPLYGNIPPLLIRGLYLWARFGDRPGGFLCAVLCNNLTEASARAHPTSAIALQPLGLYVGRELPRDCWGSPSTLDTWEAWHAAHQHRDHVNRHGRDAPPDNPF